MVMDPVRPHLRVIHVHPSPDNLGHLWVPDPGLVADPRAVVTALSRLPARRRWDD